jgi:MerR family transcriptional regulator, light-induced transcriptional regulator
MTPPDRLWTSAEVATAFRVGVSSIKRWTDEGELESVRTPGGHRRYTTVALHRFASIRGLSTEHLPPLSDPRGRVAIPPPADVTLYQSLARGNTAAVRRLVTPRVESLSKRAAFLDRVVGDALHEIGFRWERGDLTVDEEHRASHIITEAIDRLRPDMTDGPVALLACPPDELHDLPLRLVRLVLEWAGWRTEFLGAGLPWRAAHHAIEKCPEVIAFSSRTGDPFQYRDFDELLEACMRAGTRVVVGGEWARGGSGSVEKYLRFRTLRGFEKWLRELTAENGGMLSAASLSQDRRNHV